MANGTADRIGIFLDGWFLNSPDLRSVIPAEVLSIVSQWSMADSGLPEPVLDDPEQLQPPLDDAYKFLWGSRRVRGWCRNSSLWQSLCHDTHKTAFPHLFPFGSTASRLAALTLADMLLEQNRDAIIYPSAVPDENEAPIDWRIQACAKQTWQWLRDAKGKGALNLTLCPAEFKRGYKWVAALARTLSQEVELALYDWHDGLSESINVPAIGHYCGSRGFLDYYLKGIEPTSEQDKYLLDNYKLYKMVLEEQVSRSGNEKLRLALETWADWRWPERDQGEQQNRDEEVRRRLMPPPVVEGVV